MVCSAASLFFFTCRLEVETLGLTGFLNVRRSQICRGRDGDATGREQWGKQYGGGSEYV